MDQTLQSALKKNTLLKYVGKKPQFICEIVKRKKRKNASRVSNFLTATLDICIKDIMPHPSASDGRGWRS